MVLGATGGAGRPSPCLLCHSRRGRLRRRRGRGAARFSLALGGLSLVLLAGCDARLAVEIDAGPDGNGEVKASVVLDERAAAQVPDLERLLRVDDLEEAGWRVEGPTRRDDGGIRVQAVKSFRSPTGAARAMAELSGPEGPFRDFRLEVDRSYLLTRTALLGTLDLTRGLESFSDEVLAQRLGSPLGVDTKTVERQLGKPLGEAFHVEVVARLPGEQARVWSPALGERVQVAASGTRLNGERIAFGVIALAAGVALLVVLARRLLTSG